MSDSAERVYVGYTRDPQRKGVEADKSDGIVVRSTSAFPRIARRFQLGALDLCVWTSDVAVDVEPLAAGEWMGILLGYVLEGSVTVVQHGRSAELGPGRFTFYEGSSPYRISAPGAHSYLVVRVPLYNIGLHHDEIARVQMTDRPTTSARILAEVLHALGTGEDVPPPRARESLADAIVATVHAVVAEHRPIPDPSTSLGLFNTLAVWVEQHLGEDDLNAERIAADHFLSARYVRRVFSDHGTAVSDFIRQRRLERIRNDLLDPVNVTTGVGAIASRWGLSDASVFSRAFVRQYGQTPQRYRRLHLRLVRSSADDFYQPGPVERVETSG